MGNFSFDKIFRVFEEVTDFILLNFMWIACTLLGVVILGVAPSTVALLSVMRDKIMKKEKYGVVKSFWITYKREFKKSNIIGIILMILMLMVTINIMNFEAQNGTFFTVLYGVSTLAKLLIIGMSLYIFPLYVHYDMSFKEYFMKGLQLLIMRPFVTVCIAIWTFIMYLGVMLIPGLIPFLTISVYFYGIMAINYQFFMKNEDRLKSTSANSDI
ncbi:DUF624 domain-containing protein [Clostridium sp. HBUAS56017]|uniref:YesL family protein n=1 Tax=Clostridium sp. HBUAS56017 TaxID=2571128 RepID=UPI0011781EE4|nr:DUF624 domain-containing protein [Clostridium sp. HBUAS56017]